MFIDISKENRKKEYKIYLAKPNKERIAILGESYGGSYNLSLGNVNELNFNVPYYIHNLDNKVENKNIENIRPKMYLLVEYNDEKEWMIIDELDDVGEGNEKYLKVTAYTNVYENSHRMLNGIVLDTVNPEEYYAEILADTSWELGIVDPLFKKIYRSFEISNTTALEAIRDGAETFGAVLDYDTVNKKINLFDINERAKYRGLKINYKNFLQSISRKSTSDEMTTRMYAYGADGVNISNVNPTGMNYLEDFSYFMYPFERDVDKNVITKSYYMSDELCHGLLDLGELTKQYMPQIETLQSEIDVEIDNLVAGQIVLSDVEFTLNTARGLLDIAKSIDDTDLIKRRKTEVDNARILFDEQEKIVDEIQAKIDTKEKRILTLQDQVVVNSLSKELIDELNPYIIEKEFRDDRYIDEQELYEDALEHFEESREPSVQIDASIDNIIESIEGDYYSDKIKLGDLARITSDEMRVDMKSLITELTLDLDGGSHDITITNDDVDSSGYDRILSILYDTQSTTTQLANSKHKWDAVTDIKTAVDSMRDGLIDTTKNRIYAGVNESIEIGGNGIILTNPDFPEEMIIMQAGVIALSKNGGEDWSTSISPDGVVAETIVGKLIAGNNLMITNDSGSFVIDSDGLEIDMDSIKIMSGIGDSAENVLDSWNKMLITMDEFGDNNKLNTYEKNQIEKQFNSIKAVHVSMMKVVEDAYEPGDKLPLEYNLYVKAYEKLNDYLTKEIQSDGHTILDEKNRDKTTDIDGVKYTSIIQDYEIQKEKFQTIIPMDFSQTYLKALKDSISLNYVKNGEILSKLNVDESGVRIDGKLLQINSETEFNDNLTMNAGVIQSRDKAIQIDLNKGEINLGRPLTINYKPVATEEDVKDAIEKVEVGGRNLILHSDK